MGEFPRCSKVMRVCYVSLLWQGIQEQVQDLQITSGQLSSVSTFRKPGFQTRIRLRITFWQRNSTPRQLRETCGFYA